MNSTPFTKEEIEAKKASLAYMQVELMENYKRALDTIDGQAQQIESLVKLIEDQGRHMAQTIVKARNVVKK